MSSRPKQMASAECAWTATYGQKNTDIKLSVHIDIQVFFGVWNV